MSIGDAFNTQEKRVYACIRSHESDGWQGFMRSRDILVVILLEVFFHGSAVKLGTLGNCAIGAELSIKQAAIISSQLCHGQIPILDFSQKRFFLI